MRRRIGLDADGVVLDGARQKARVLKELYGIDIDPSFFKKSLIEKAGLTRDQYEAMKEVAYNDRDEALKFEFIPGAKEYILQMLQLQWGIYVISTRNSSAASYVDELFAQHQLPLTVMSSERSDDKSQVVSSIDGGIEVYVDDDLLKLLALRGWVSELYLFTQPYNVTEKVPEGILRVDCWSDLFQRIAGKQVPAIVT